jgi:hypothetical protein
LKGWGEKSFKNLIQCGSGAFGNAAGEGGFGLITDFAYTAPYEDITIKPS